MKERLKLVVRDDGPGDGGRMRSALLIAGTDVLLIALGLFAFLFFRYGIVRTQPGLGIVSPRTGSPYVMTAAFSGADNGGENGIFDFPGLFDSASPVSQTEGDVTYYRDSSCALTLSTYYLSAGPVYVADVYVGDIARIGTALANDSYGKGQREDALALANRADALFSITGDNYSERYCGVVMRDGVLYSEDIYRDVCVLNWDGTVDLYSADEFDLTAAMEKNPYQIWSFGPILVKEGAIPDAFDTDQISPARRAALGYYEPGHYCFVLMEGETTLESLAKTMRDLGCQGAYALYGGTVARMTYDGAEVSIPQEAVRPCSDLITISK